MTGLVSGLALAAAVAWLIARAVRQLRAFPVLGPAHGGEPSPSVTVIVPARDEEDVLARCLAGLAAQDYAGRLTTIVVDDGSRDGTAAIAARVAAGDPRFRLLAAGALPPGWTGKPHACWRGAQAAGAADYLCFIDADTAAAPALLRSAVREAARRGLDLLSLEPRQELESPWERLILPAGLFALAFACDLRRASDPRSGAASANGQFMLVRSAAYWQIGGHAAVRDAIAEDSRLAQMLKRGGFSVAVMSGGELVRTRMYRGFAALWQGIAKSSTEALGGPSRVMAVVLLGVPLAWTLAAVPAVLAARLAGGGSDALSLAGAALAGVASLAAFALHVAGARFLGVPAWYGLFFPVGYTLAAAMALDGLVRRGSGHIRWKGRVYPRPAARASE